jgi:hypothetical protein
VQRSGTTRLWLGCWKFGHDTEFLRKQPAFQPFPLCQNPSQRPNFIQSFHFGKNFSLNDSRNLDTIGTPFELVPILQN